jgi:hypothetical protein
MGRLLATTFLRSFRPYLVFWIGGFFLCKLNSLDFLFHIYTVFSYNKKLIKTKIDMKTKHLKSREPPTRPFLLTGEKIK